MQTVFWKSGVAHSDTVLQFRDYLIDFYQNKAQRGILEKQAGPAYAGAAFLLGKIGAKPASPFGKADMGKFAAPPPRQNV